MNKWTTHTYIHIYIHTYIHTYIHAERKKVRNIHHLPWMVQTFMRRDGAWIQGLTCGSMDTMNGQTDRQTHRQTDRTGQQDKKRQDRHREIGYKPVLKIATRRNPRWGRWRIWDRVDRYRWSKRRCRFAGRCLQWTGTWKGRKSW